MGEKTSLRKCIRPLVELSAPGHDELRAYLSLLVARSLSTNSSSRFPDTPSFFRPCCFSADLGG